MSDLRLNTPNSISAGAPPQTPLGDLTVIPRPLAGFKGPTSKERQGIVWKTEGRGKKGGGE